MFFRGGVLFTNGRADLFNKGCFQHLEQTRGFDLCVMQRRVKVVPLHHLWPRPEAPFQSGWPSLALCLPHTEGETEDVLGLVLLARVSGFKLGSKNKNVCVFSPLGLGTERGMSLALAGSRQAKEP